MPAQNLPGLMLDRAHPLARGLVGWWPMNEGAGTRINDISGNGNHGLSTGQPRWAGDYRGTALVFDGTDDKIVVPHNASLSITDKFTLSVWINLNAGAAGQPSFFGKRSAGGPANYLLWFSGGTTLSYYDGGISVSTYTITRGKLILATAVKVGAVVSFYVDGGFVSSAACSASPPTNTDPFLIGSDSFNQWTMGSLRNGRIYNRALSAVEVAQLYADPLAGALAPSRAARYYVAASVSPPAAIAAPPTADRLWNRGYVGRIFRRGEKG